MLVDYETKYVHNILPYLGAIEKETRNGKTLAEDVVLRLTRGLQNKGYNVTMDNFFTSPNLATMLSSRGMTMVGTIRQNRTRVPEEVKNIALNRYDSAFFWNTSHRQLLVRYQAKQKNTGDFDFYVTPKCTYTPELQEKTSGHFILQ